MLRAKVTGLLNIKHLQWTLYSGSKIITTFSNAVVGCTGYAAAPLSALTESVSKRSRIHDTSSVRTSNVFGFDFNILDVLVNYL